jgi:hypothetical protein
VAGQPRDAPGVCDTALQVDPTLRVAHLNLARLSLRMERGDRAAIHAADAVRLGLPRGIGAPPSLCGLYLSPPWRLFYRGFYDQTPVAEIGNSIRVYWVDRWPEAADSGPASDVSDHASLADGCCSGSSGSNTPLSITART